MELLERNTFLATFRTLLDRAGEGEGHCVFVSGEAGIGKTSLVRAFCETIPYPVYQGTCDALFTPRPLAPLYDILWQIRDEAWDTTDRSALFLRFFQELADREGPVVLLFEDIHWADEATLDFIKFLGRRVSRLHCLFVLTYRDDEVHGQHPLRTVLGDLPPDAVIRMQLPALSRETVDRLALAKGYDRENVYAISGGNPFYVQEILASYSTGVPDNVKDAILSVYDRQGVETKRIWNVLSVHPSGFEIHYLERMEPSFAAALENSFIAKILVVRGGKVFFKHELYRRTIEASLTPPSRMALHKKVLELFLEAFAAGGEPERIIHHATEAGELELVVRYLPLAAERAAAVGAHREAARLYLSAIDYAGSRKDLLRGFYEAYAYECYLTNQVREAIDYQERALALRQEKGDVEALGNCLRFLSRLWWYAGNCTQSEVFGKHSIAVLANQPASGTKAMAFSNMSQLCMLADEFRECIFWGEQAIAMAGEVNEPYTLSHALNNVGSARMRDPLTREKGQQLLQESLDLALRHSFHEHAARSYTNFACNGVEIKDYVLAEWALNEGIAYSEKRDLDAWSTYMLSWKSKMLLETDRWDEAARIAEAMVRGKRLSPVTRITTLVVLARIHMRRGQEEVLPLLYEAKSDAFVAMELQRIGPVLSALLEYEWLTGKVFVDQEALDTAIGLKSMAENGYLGGEFEYWLRKARGQDLGLPNVFAGYRGDPKVWEQVGCTYERALCLFDGNDADKRQAITLMQDLGAVAVCEKMKQDMRASGIKHIPRGARRTTLANPALLTGRELDVLQRLKDGMANKEIASNLYISAKTVDHHISSILFKLDAPSRVKAVQQALRLGILP